MPLDAGPSREQTDGKVLNFSEYKKDEQADAPKSGSPEMFSLIIREAGYSSPEEVITKLAELRAEREASMLSVVGKIKDRIFNSGKEIARITELEKQIAKLSRLSKLIPSKDGESQALRKAA